MEYLHWDEKTINDFSEKAVSEMYANGYVFTRIGKGAMHQTRSVRIDLSKFELSSENRRILKKTGGLMLKVRPIPFEEYHWSLGKLAKDFYETKFGAGIMSAMKVKEMLTDPALSNFNSLLAYTDEKALLSDSPTPIGFCIAYENRNLVHYSYPFYDLEKAPKDMGMGMMIRAIEYAKNSGKSHIYLGSLQRPGDSYKLQFSGLEWFDGKEWSTDMEAAKASIAQAVA